jgi:hypothetical protein
MRLGKVVRSNSHCDYVVQVDDALEVKTLPPLKTMALAALSSWKATNGTGLWA